MFNLVTRERKDQKLTFEDLVIAKATYEKGTKDEIEDFIYHLLDVSNDGILGRSDLEAVLSEMLDCVFSSKDHELGLSNGEEILDIYLNAATLSKDVEGCEKSMSPEDLRSWFTLLPSVRKFLGNLLMPSDLSMIYCILVQTFSVIHFTGINFLSNLSYII